MREVRAQRAGPDQGVGRHPAGARSTRPGGSKRSRAGGPELPGAAGPCCSCPGIRPARRANGPPRGSARGPGAPGARCRRGARRSRSPAEPGRRCRILAPVAWQTASNEVVKLDPRSRIESLMFCRMQLAQLQKSRRRGLRLLPLSLGCRCWPVTIRDVGPRAQVSPASPPSRRRSPSPCCSPRTRSRHQPRPPRRRPAWPPASPSRPARR